MLATSQTSQYPEPEAQKRLELEMSTVYMPVDSVMIPVHQDVQELGAVLNPLEDLRPKASGLSKVVSH